MKPPFFIVCFAIDNLDLADHVFRWIYYSTTTFFSLFSHSVHSNANWNACNLYSAWKLTVSLRSISFLAFAWISPYRKYKWDSALLWHFATVFFFTQLKPTHKPSHSLWIATPIDKILNSNYFAHASVSLFFVEFFCIYYIFFTAYSPSPSSSSLEK